MQNLSTPAEGANLEAARLDAAAEAERLVEQLASDVELLATGEVLPLGAIVLRLMALACARARLEALAELQDGAA
jgi:hypothetical protein